MDGAPLRGTIPRHEFVTVEIPFIVKNVDKALHMIGGCSAVQQAVSATDDRPSTIKIRLREAVHAHPVLAEREFQQTVVISVNKRTQTARFLGTSTTTFRNRGLADFQYIPPTRDRSDLSITVASGPVGLVPQLFSITAPKAYNFKSLKSTMQYPQVNKNRKPLVLDMLVPEAAVPARATEVDTENPFAGAVKEMFQKRPIWTLRLAKLLNPKPWNPVLLRSALINEAYYCLNGPFKKCWIKYGLDPRKYVEARFFQIMDMRTDRADRPPLTARAHQPRANRRLGVAGIIDRNPIGGLVQLCDVLDPEHIQILQDAIPLEEFDATTGWFPAETLRLIKERAKTLMADNIPMLAWEGVYGEERLVPSQALLQAAAADLATVTAFLPPPPAAILMDLDTDMTDAAAAPLSPRRILAESLVSVDDSIEAQLEHFQNTAAIVGTGYDEYDLLESDVDSDNEDKSDNDD
eukprot:TRINITY_DN15665_c0_g1_i1.p1 TRINITY_DN15665_c0_g1~~TRINITY_DN15665_c0_g1_i1.p1  ORF type:complete len:464 (+),score=119.16 TRINITY_DN15665_c0_g1_i1:68-1459(+)